MQMCISTSVTEAKGHGRGRHHGHVNGCGACSTAHQCGGQARGAPTASAEACARKHARTFDRVEVVVPFHTRTYALPLCTGPQEEDLAALVAMLEAPSALHE